jgi:hypothetical protein
VTVQPFIEIDKNEWEKFFTLLKKRFRTLVKIPSTIMFPQYYCLSQFVSVVNYLRQLTAYGIKIAAIYPDFYKKSQLLDELI